MRFNLNPLSWLDALGTLFAIGFARFVGMGNVAVAGHGDADDDHVPEVAAYKDGNKFMPHVDCDGIVHSMEDSNYIL